MALGRTAQREAAAAAYAKEVLESVSHHTEDAPPAKATSLPVESPACTPAQDISEDPVTGAVSDGEEETSFELVSPIISRAG